MTDSFVVAALVGLTLAALTYTLGGQWLLAAGVLVLGALASLGLVWTTTGFDARARLPARRRPHARA